MRKLAVHILRLLDGTPAVYGKRQAGQSVVELALITPILIILLAGLVEIGWFANNYLNLLDVSRTGARRGSVLQDQKSPLFWDNKYSYVPNTLFDVQTPTPPTTSMDGFKMPNTDPADADVNGTDAQRFTFRWMPSAFTALGGTGEQACADNIIDRVFYNEVICTMITSMEPLVLNPENGIDDIVLTAYSLQLINASAQPDWLDASYDSSQAQMVVVGRYPSNANECDVGVDGSGNPTPLFGGREGRDPFDFNGNGVRDIKPPFEDPIIVDGVNDFTELIGYDAIGADTDHMEKQVGFSLFGNQKIPNTYCTGSQWTMADMEDLMNVPNLGLLTNQEKESLPSQGVVLVEIFWEHEMLLKIPVLSPVYTAVGNQNGKMVIRVWAAFPLAAVEPHILFP